MPEFRMKIRRGHIATAVRWSSHHCPIGQSLAAMWPEANPREWIGAWDAGEDVAAHYPGLTVNPHVARLSSERAAGSRRSPGSRRRPRWSGMAPG